MVLHLKELSIAMHEVTGIELPKAAVTNALPKIFCLGATANFIAYGSSILWNDLIEWKDSPYRRLPQYFCSPPPCFSCGYTTFTIVYPVWPCLLIYFIMPCCSLQFLPML